MGFKGGYIDIGRGDLSAVQGGFGLNLDLRYRWSNGVSIGFGTELAWPGSDLGEVIEPSLADFQFITVFFEPRYNFLFQRSSVSPFIGARVSYARMNFNVFTPPEETLLGYVVGERVLVLANSGQNDGMFSFDLPEGEWLQVVGRYAVDLDGIDSEYALLPGGTHDLRVQGGSFLVWVRK